MTNSQSLKTPQFILDYSEISVNDYRPVPVLQEGTDPFVIFERTIFSSGGSSQVLLFSHSINNTSGAANLFLTNFAGPQTRPDWSPYPLGTAGTIAFVQNGIWTVSADGGDLNPVNITNSDTYTYPAWYPDGEYLAVFNFEDSTHSCQKPHTSKIDLNGNVISQDLGDSSIYMGMSAVNQSNQNQIASAAQYIDIDGTGCYNQNYNYIWLSQDNASSPLEPQAPIKSFNSDYQGRAPWFSPNGDWVVFESNRMCTNASTGEGYALFLMATDGTGTATQLTCTSWGAQHAKWVNDTTLIFTCYQRQTQNPCSGKIHRGIATIDVSDFMC